MRRVDKLLAGYILFVTFLIVVGGRLSEPESWYLLGMHALVGVLLLLFGRLRPGDRVGTVLHDLYPLLLLPVLYTELGVLTMQRGIAHTFSNDAVVQHMEAAVFGGQISYEWIRHAPSTFWSGLLHLAYLSYYAIVGIGPLVFTIRGESARVQRLVLTTMIAFVACYVVFALFPVAGPNYAFEHPTGPAVDVWSARLVYGLLGAGSSFGTAFPSSHVAATVAANAALWWEWRSLGWACVVPTMLLIVGTVYCQMHYGIDALTGLAVGIAAAWIGINAARRVAPS